jgi:hypothetical protein
MDGNGLVNVISLLFSLFVFHLDTPSLTHNGLWTVWIACNVMYQVAKSGL